MSVIHRLKYATVLLLIITAMSQVSAATKWLGGDVYLCNASDEVRSNVIVPSLVSETLAALVTQGQCSTSELYEVNPQNNHLILVIPFEQDEQLVEITPPLGLYAFAKTSSHIYLNGELVGTNGKPGATTKDEVPGQMDTSYYIKTDSFIADTNYLVVEMSSHHGYLELAHPIHLIGFASYRPVQSYIQQATPVGLVLSGLFTLGCFYFATLMFSASRQPNITYFLALCITINVQLWLEMSRALFPYDYPFQDIRLLLITACSYLIGLLMLLLISASYATKNRIHWIYITAGITLVSILLVPSYDLKTTISVLLPSFVAAILIAIDCIKNPVKENVIYLLIFVAFLVLIINSLSFFHEIIFYIIMAVMLSYLFIRQAIDFSNEQGARHEDEKKLAQLAYRLDQAKQQAKPKTITLPSAGGMTIVSTSDITHCKAAGDYVEIFFVGTDRKLYSGNLKKLLEQLPANFLRVHRSFAVNMEYVINIQSSQTSGVITLHNGEEIPVSRRLLPSVRSVFAEGL